MEFKLSPLEIPSDQPFRFDRLKRGESVTTLVSLIQNLSGPYVIAVDSPWGTGKTTFLGFLRAVLEAHGIACLYFDAWKTDFSTDPLIAFLGELNENLPNGAKDDARFNQFFGNAKRIASVLARRAIPVAGKIATAGILDLDDFTEQTISEFVGTQLNDAVDSYTAEKKLIQSFRKNLSDALDSIDYSQANHKLVIVVDELDRCKPTYAIQLLERIKHLFDLENVIFIIALDKQQLGVSIGAVYGAGIDADEYLRRFFDLEYSLPKADPAEFTKCLYERFGFDEFFDARTHSELRHEKQHLLDIFVALSQLLGLSLRAREQCFSRIRIALLMTKENHFLYPIMVSTLAMLKVANPSLYLGYAFGSTTSREVVDFLASKPGGSELLNSHFGAIIETYIIVSKTSPHEDSAELVECRVLANDSSIADEARARVNRILEIANYLSSMNPPQLHYIVSKLELAAQFDR